MIKRRRDIFDSYLQAVCGSAFTGCDHYLRVFSANAKPQAAHTNFFPVNRSYASTYFARVLSTTSAGNCGGGLFLSQPESSSQSRTNCLSYEGGFLPG